MNRAESKSIVLITAITILSAAAVMSNLPSFPKRSVGSFEYVRKGEECLDKGSYGRSIKYFEKAYEASPENEAIASDLIYAYSVYSRVLADQKKYDEAIDCLNRAYGVAPNSSTIQDLASGYSEKALYEANKGLTQFAKNDYARARRYASMSDTAARNTGIILYNDGVGEFKSGREWTALLCLKESSLIYKDARTSEFTGDIYYKKADLKRARYYWHAAFLLSPDNIILSKKIKKVAKEIALAAREKEAEIPHFEIRYAEGLPLDKEFIARTLEKAYLDIGKDLGYFPGARTKIFFYSEKDFKDTFNMPYFVKAFYDGSIKMPSPQTQLDKEKLAQYIYHEYTHAIVSAKTNNNCPVWLSEGLAVWEEFKKENIDMREISGKIRRAPEISFKFMDESFKTDEISENKALCYVLGYTLVDFILGNWGMPGLRGVLKRLSDKQHIVNAIDDELLISEKDFEKKWRHYVVEKFFKNNS